MANPMPFVNAGIGALTGYLGAKGSNKAGKAAMKYLDPNAIISYRDVLFPQLADASLDDFLTQLTNQTNRTYGNAVGSYRDTLARSGMLGSGLDMGGHGALQLARGSQLGQNKIQALQALMQLLFGGTEQAMQGQLTRAGLQSQQKSPLTAALAGAAGGLINSFGMGGGFGQGGGGGFGMGGSTLGGTGWGSPGGTVYM